MAQCINISDWQQNKVQYVNYRRSFSPLDYVEAGQAVDFLNECWSDEESC